MNTLNSLILNAHHRSDPVLLHGFYLPDGFAAKYLRTTKWIGSKVGNRFTQGAILLFPPLSCFRAYSQMFFPTQTAIALGLNNIVASTLKIKNYQILSDSEKKFIKDPKYLFVDLIGTVSVLVLTIFAPKTATVVSHISVIVRTFTYIDLKQQLKEKKYLFVVKVVAVVAHCVVIVSSVVSAKPKLIAASLITGSLVDLIESIEFAGRNENLMSVNFFALSILRLFAFKNFCEQNHLFSSTFSPPNGGAGW